MCTRRSAAGSIVLVALVLAVGAIVGGARASAPASRVLILEWLPGGRGERALVVDGSTGRALGAHRTDQGALWSPDGRHIAVESADRHLVLLDANAGSARKLPIVSYGLGPFPDVAWAPDGRRLVVTRGNALTVRGLDGRVLQVLVRKKTASESFGQPAWSPDGRWVAFEHRGGEAGSFDGYEVMPARGGPRTVLFSVADDHDTPHIEWSPRSDALLRVGGDQRVESDPTLAVVDTRTQRMRVLPIPERSVVSAATWSPDGREVAFVYWLRARRGIAVDDLATGQLRRIGTRRLPWSVSWSPDGRSLVAVTGGGSQVEVVPAAGGPSRVLLPRSRPWTFSTAAWQPRR